MGEGDKCGTIVKDNAFTCIVTSISTLFYFLDFFSHFTFFFIKVLDDPKNSMYYHESIKYMVFVLLLRISPYVFYLYFLMTE